MTRNTTWMTIKNQKVNRELTFAKKVYLENNLPENNSIRIIIPNIIIPIRSLSFITISAA